MGDGVTQSDFEDALEAMRTAVTDGDKEAFVNQFLHASIINANIAARSKAGDAEVEINADGLREIKVIAELKFGDLRVAVDSGRRDIRGRTNYTR